MARELLEVDIRGLAEVQKTLDEIASETDPRDVLDEIAAVLINRIRIRFLNQEDPSGNKWPESEAAKKRRDTGRDGGTLFDRGILFRSIQAFNRGPEEIAIATDVPYAPIHQFGLGNQETRVFLGFSDEDIEVAEKLVVDRLEKAVQ